MLIDVALLLSLALVTLPLFAITVYTLQADKRLLGELMRHRHKQGAQLGSDGDDE